MSIRTERAHELMDAFGVHDYTALGELLTPDATWADIPAGRTSRGHNEIVEYLAEWHRAFADAHVANARYTNLPDRRVLLECDGEGRQSGQFGPFPNTGGAFSLPSVLIYSFDNHDLISHVDLYYDTIMMLTQLGHMQAQAA